MYLVQIIEKKVSDKWVESPSIEKLQAFEFQLFSPEWCALDCIPEKGGSFEVHYGHKMGQPLDDDSDRVVAVMIAPDSATALSCAARVMRSRQSGCYDFTSGCVLLWSNNESEANNFFTPSIY